MFFLSGWGSVTAVLFPQPGTFCCTTWSCGLGNCIKTNRTEPSSWNKVWSWLGRRWWNTKLISATRTSCIFRNNDTTKQYSSIRCAAIYEWPPCHRGLSWQRKPSGGISTTCYAICFYQYQHSAEDEFWSISKPAMWISTTDIDKPRWTCCWDEGQP